ncbi:hypothetical protein B0J17DRAFT_661641 [Rhizoctonia solani]|nr:hypothetical protein B0J17DRAFT_661641 [Rhizoctonia solani]
MKDLDGSCKLYAQVGHLISTHVEDSSIHWFSKRAWFDDCLKAIRYQSMNNGFWWTGAWFPAVYTPKEGELSDSYHEHDHSMWEP